MPSRSNSRPIASASAFRPLIGRTITVSSATLPVRVEAQQVQPVELSVADPGGSKISAAASSLSKLVGCSGSPRTPSSRPRSGSPTTTALALVGPEDDRAAEDDVLGERLGERLGVLGLDRGSERVALHAPTLSGRCRSPVDRPGA